MHIKQFTFNLFQENTYIIYNQNKNCWIIDPGCSNWLENKQISDFIEHNQLKPKRLLLSHAHIDHVLGCKFINDQFGLIPELHINDLETYQISVEVAYKYGMDYEHVSEYSTSLEGDTSIFLDDECLDIVFTPGHSPGSVCFINHHDEWIIGGDVLFLNSIGRSDLPGGDFEVLKTSIITKLYTLPDHYKVYSGHGPATNIGYEKMNNPFVNLNSRSGL